MNLLIKWSYLLSLNIVTSVVVVISITINERIVRNGIMSYSVALINSMRARYFYEYPS